LLEETRKTMIRQRLKLKRKRGRPPKKLEDKLSKVLTTDKQKAFLRNRMAGMNKRQSAIRAGYAPSTASIMAKRITDKLSGDKDFLKELERQGLSISYIVKKLKELLDSLEPFYPVWPGNMAEIRPFYPVWPGNMAEISALELVIEILDFSPSQKVEILKTVAPCELAVDDLRCPEKCLKKEAPIIEEDVDEDANDINMEEEVPF